MHWLAWHLPPIEATTGPATGSVIGLPPAAQGWWALRFTPRVALVDEALLLEVSGTERLWGGRAALQSLLRDHAPPGPETLEGGSLWASAPTALQALALLRLQRQGRPVPRRLPHDLPVATLSALRPHAQALQQLGCRTWGAVRALPRAGVARRFGAEPLAALDRAWGDAPHGLDWITLPEQFALELELPALAESAPALLWAGQRLLDALQGWLRARHQGVQALELAWRHDLRRIDGVDLPPWQSLTLRTAEPLQGMAHLRRLLAERLAHQRLAAPVSRLALRSLQTAPMPQASADLLPPQPGDAGAGQGEPWHQFVERLSARLGADSLRVPRSLADHRPECMQQWQPALAARAAPPAPAQNCTLAPLLPPWLVRPPRPLALRGSRPCLHGQPLRLLDGPQRVETGWWEAAADLNDDESDVHGNAHNGAQDGGSALVQRDYFVAHNPAAGTVWVFRDRATGGWFLQGVYG